MSHELFRDTRHLPQEWAESDLWGDPQQATLSWEATVEAFCRCPLAGTGPESGAEGEGLVRLVSQAWGEFVSVALVSARRGRPPQGAGPGLVPGTPGLWRPGDTGLRISPQTHLAPEAWSQ